MSRFTAYSPEGQQGASHLRRLIWGRSPGPATPKALDLSVKPYAPECLVPYVMGDLEMGGRAVCRYRDEAGEQLAFNMVFDSLPSGLKPGAVTWGFMVQGENLGDPFAQEGIVTAKWLPSERAQA